MTLDTTLIVALVVIVVIMIALFKGVVQAFKRQPVVAALFLIFLFPVFFFWIIVEALFLESPE